MSDYRTLIKQIAVMDTEQMTEFFADIESISDIGVIDKIRIVANKFVDNFEG